MLAYKYDLEKIYGFIIFIVYDETGNFISILIFKVKKKHKNWNNAEIESR